MISEENPNRWDNEYVIRAYDHTKKEQRDFSLTEFTEEDWRKWVCWKLDQQDKRIKLLEVLLKNIAGEAEKQGLVRKRK